MAKLDCGCNWTGDKWETICLEHMLPQDLRAKVQALELQISAYEKRIPELCAEYIKKLEESNRLKSEALDTLRAIWKLASSEGKPIPIGQISSLAHEAVEKLEQPEKRIHEHRYNTVESNPKTCLDCGEGAEKRNGLGPCERCGGEGASHKIGCPRWNEPTTVGHD